MTTQRWYAIYIVSFFCGTFAGLFTPVLRVDLAHDSGKWFLPLATWVIAYGRTLSLLAFLCLSIAAYRRRDQTDRKECVVYFFLGFFVSRILYAR